MKKFVPLTRLSLLPALLMAVVLLAACVTVYTGQPPASPGSAAAGEPAAATAPVVAAVTVQPVVAQEPAAKSSATAAVEAEVSDTPAPPPTETMPPPADTSVPTSTMTVPPTQTATFVPSPTDTPAPLPSDTATAIPKAPDQKGTGRGGATTVPPTDTPAPDSATDRKAGGSDQLTPTPSPAPHTRTLYSDAMIIGAKLLPVFGGKADAPINKGRILPVGCTVVGVNGIDYHWTKPVPPPASSINHKDHGFTISRLSDNPRDLGVNLHFWYNAPANIWVRAVYTIHEDWNVDCNIAGWTQIEP